MSRALFIVLIFTVTAAWAWDAPLVRPGLPLIFPDNGQIASSEGIDLAFHRGVKDRDPVLRKDRPWESKGCHVYGSVWKTDDGSYRMWYNDWSSTLVADSTDGRIWVKPYLTEGGTATCPSNNICRGASGHCVSVIFDGFEVEPSRRFKHIGTGYTYNDDWSINTNKTGYYTCVGPDGLVFTDYHRALYGWDTVSLAQHPETGEIFCYHKIMTPGIAGRPEKRRVVYLARSQNFDNWSSPTLVLAPDAQDDASFTGAANRRMDIYTHTAFPYAGGFLGFMTMFKIDESHPAQHGETTDYGVSEVQIATSPDGVTWSRTPNREYVLTVGESGNWDCGGIWGLAGGEVVCVGDESMLYYYGLDNAHGRKLRTAETEISTGRAVWRRWGFVSRGTAGTGRFRTKPVRFHTSDLRLNAAPQGEGPMSVVVSVYAQDGTSRLAESLPVTKDATQAPLVWKDGATVPTNVAVCLQFDLTAACVYAVECQGAWNRYTPLDRPVWIYDRTNRPPDAVGEASATLACNLEGTGARTVGAFSEGPLESRASYSRLLPALPHLDEGQEWRWPNGLMLFLN